MLLGLDENSYPIVRKMMYQFTRYNYHLLENVIGNILEESQTILKNYEYATVQSIMTASYFLRAKIMLHKEKYNSTNPENLIFSPVSVPNYRQIDFIMKQSVDS